MMTKKGFREKSGITLIEMLLVVILLGILAMLIIPQISVSTGDANLNTLQTNLSTIRNALNVTLISTTEHTQVSAKMMGALGQVMPSQQLHL
jgi:prepilin-type N-terminal cleavage/methylation domain-containing protein